MIIRLSRNLKKRVARAARRPGATAHAFILGAIAEKIDREEGRLGFMDTAERRYAEIVASGETVSWNEMCRYLKRRLAGAKRR